MDHDPPPRRIDLNADVGEGLPPAQDRALMELVSSASIACGGHAGDAATMRRTLLTAAELGLRIGAHPSYPDREGFGRRAMTLGPDQLIDCIGEQVSALQETALQAGLRVGYLKPHGALYHAAAADEEVAQAVATAAALLGLPLMLLAGSPTLGRLPAGGPYVIREGFLDRAYRDGLLVPRHEDGALITDPDAAAAQALSLTVTVDSLCVHSDSPSAPTIAGRVRAALEQAGIEIGP